MGVETEGLEIELSLDLTCKKIIAHLENVRQNIATRQAQSANIESMMNNIGGGIGQHNQEELKYIDEIITSVEQKNATVLQKFLDKPFRGLELTEEEKKTLREYCQSQTIEKAA